MKTKFYKWVSPFSDGIDQVVMIHSGISCRVNDFGIDQKIEYLNYEVITDDMTIATKAEFLRVYSKVNGEMLSRMLNTIL
jgi:hypothetical protein